MENDPLKKIWACSCCGNKRPLGEMIAADTLRCPVCRSCIIEPADGRSVSVENSQWALPPVTN